MEEGKKKMTPEELRAFRLSNLKPFKPLDELTEEERKEQIAKSVKGGTSRGEQVRKAKSMKEDALQLLSIRLSRQDAEKLIGESAKMFSDDELTVQKVLLVSALKEANENGNVKAMEFLRDTSGQAPKQQIEVQADIMTDADRELIANVQKRIV